MDKQAAQPNMQRTGARRPANQRREPAKVMVGEGILPDPPPPLM